MVDVVDDDGDAQIFFQCTQPGLITILYLVFFCLLIPIFGLCGIVDSIQKFVLRRAVRIPGVPF